MSKNIATSVDVVRRFLDRTYPEVGLDCPIFPAMAVVFAAAIMGNANLNYLQEFTQYRREFIDAIASNMTNNGLWKDDQYPAFTWLQEGHIDEKVFINHVRAAMGELCYSREAWNRRIDVLWINPT